MMMMISTKHFYRA